jgi:hypothetical protein
MQKIVNKQKAPKDILLNKILKEIGEENGVVVEEPKPEQEVREKPKKRSWLRVLFIIMLLLVIGLSAFVGYVVYSAAQQNPVEKKPVVKKEKNLPVIEPVKEMQTPKPIEDHVIQMKIPQTKKKETKQTLPKAPLTPEELKAQERKKAKAALLQQMKN